jgi:hypothetical protein
VDVRILAECKTCALTLTDGLNEGNSAGQQAQPTRLTSASARQLAASDVSVSPSPAATPSRAGDVVTEFWED